MPNYRSSGVGASGTRSRNTVRGRAHANGIESFRALLKRACVGTDHRMSATHVRHYVEKFAGRHYLRHAATADPASGPVGKRVR